MHKGSCQLFSFLTLALVRAVCRREFLHRGAEAWGGWAAFLKAELAIASALLQSAYAALHDLVFGAWYARRRTGW